MPHTARHPWRRGNSFAFTHGKRSDEHVSARHWRARLSTLTPLTFPSALGYSWVCQRRLALLPQLLFATQAGATPFPRHLNVDIPKAARVARYRTPFASSRDAESSDDPQRSLCATPTSTSPESGKCPKLALSQIVRSTCIRCHWHTRHWRQYCDDRRRAA